jgi:hypothetical protein
MIECKNLRLTRACQTKSLLIELNQALRKIGWEGVDESQRMT